MTTTGNWFQSHGTDEAERRIEQFIEEYGFEDAGTTGGRRDIRRLARETRAGDVPDERERPPHPDHDELIIADVGERQRKPVAFVNHIYGDYGDDGTPSLPDEYIEDFEAFAEQYGLDVDVRPDLSWYNPGRTVAVIYTRGEDDE